jgi:hypothetical protein
MADFMFLQPSCDIHLVRDPAFRRNGNSLNNLKLTVFEGKWQPPQGSSPRNSRDFKIDPVTDPNRITIDFYPNTQNIVAYDPPSGELRPLNAGEVFMQVRLADLEQGSPDGHHYVVARIQVHDTMNGWWFGNNSLSVFRDDVLAHSQVSLYALFDETQPGEGLVGDITGHGYVELSSTNTALFDKSAKYQDRIQGKAVGTDTLRGQINTPMLNQAHDLRVEVVDFTGTLLPLLENVDVQFSKPRIEQHNILFLAEGFTADEKDVFNSAVTKVAGGLRGNARHSPYNLLKDGFNIWKAFVPSKERGITLSREVMATGEHRGSAIPFRFTFKDSISLLELVQIAGLPSLRNRDHRKTPAVLRQAWKEPDSDATLAGYRDENVKDEIIEEWKANHSEGILQALDSFYGLRYGFRPGERYSHSSAAPPITAATPNANGLSPFVQRIHEWFTSEITVQVINEDWRRFAPELRYSVLIENGTPHLLKFSLGNLILDHIRQLTVLPGTGVTGTDLNVGQLWHNDFVPTGTADRREVSSRGLVCVLINDGHIGGSMFNNQTILGVTLDDKQQIATALDAPASNIRRLNRQLNRDLPFNPASADDRAGKNLKLTGLIDVAAHEFGHGLVLGDEYEISGGVGSSVADLWDNLTFYDEISVLPPTPLGQSPKIDPDRVKWLSLHRIARADSIVERAERLTSNQVRVTLAPGRVARWSDGEALYLRMQKGDLEFFRRQLPINAQTEVLQLQVDGPPNATQNTIVLKGNNLPPSLDEFRAGSVLLIPKRFRADALVRDAEKLTTTELKVTLEPGKVSRWRNGERTFLHSGSGNEVLELFISADPSVTENTITLRTISFFNTLPETLHDFRTGSLLSDDRDYKDNAEKFLGERAVLDDMRNEHTPLSDNFKDSAPNGCREPLGDEATDPDKPRRIGGMKQLCKDYRLIGLYEGGNGNSCRVYRPAGGCKMRNQSGEGREGEFCFVCKYLIVNRVDAGQHDRLDDEYPRPKK